MKRRRCRVRCWVCGYRARRMMFPPIEEVWVPVVLRRRKVLAAFGCCPKCLTGDWPERVDLLRRRDARMVLRAAVEYDRKGYNRHSEYD